MRSKHQVLGVCLLISTATLMAEDIHRKFVGTWVWNKAESSVAPDLTWTSFVYTISAADGQIFREIDTLVLQGGKSSTEKLNAPNDGLYHAVAGSSSHEQDRVTQNTDGSIRIETKDDFGSRIMLCSLSDHFGRMTCLSQETFKCKEETETYVFHRK